jgi:hypothetical protein
MESLNINIVLRCYLWYRRINIWYRISFDIKLWIFDIKEKSYRNPGHVALGLFGEGVMQPGQRELPLRSDIVWMALNAISYTLSNGFEPDMLWHNLRYRTSERPSISYTISTCDIERFMFDIEGLKPRYQQPCSWPSISKVGDFRYWIIRPSISNTFDIVIWYWRYKTSISNEHSISKSSISNEHSILKSSISNVTLDIEGPTLDIGVARIQMLRHGDCRQCDPSRSRVKLPGIGSHRDWLAARHSDSEAAAAASLELCAIWIS